MAHVRLAAIGDSFTEGVGDEVDGVPRGWADMVAHDLARLHGTVLYSSQAVRGRLMDAIVTEQLDAALSLDPTPTILTLAGGGNDVLRPGVDLEALARKTLDATTRAQDAGVEQVVLIATADPSGAGLPLGRLVHARGRAYTDLLRGVATDTGSLFVNVFDDETLHDPAYWIEDRLHLNAHGHRYAADLVMRTLGHDPELDRAPAPPHRSGMPIISELRYHRRYVAPWIGRRLRGRSSGDGRSPKYPAWQRLQDSLDNQE